MHRDAQHCSFVLLAEFDIFKGAQLTYQFPQPLGTDEGLLANLMLPDGAEKHLEDWTIFFLNQTPFNTIAPVLALEPHGSNGYRKDGSATELLYVLNLVRTKQDKSLPRGALVKAMAICTRHPFIQIFKPILLMALDDYFADPSQECLSRLFDAVNSMDLSGAPVLTRHEKLIMRASERKDVFLEKFMPVKGHHGDANGLTVRQRPGADSSVDTRSSFEEGILARTRERDSEDSPALLPQQPLPGQSSPSEASFSLGGSAVWVGDEGGDHTMNGRDRERASISTTRNRLSLDNSSNSSCGAQQGGGVMHVSTGDHLQGIKDTHFYPTTIAYKGHQLPIKMPLSTFPEEVGDYSLIQLIQTFSTTVTSVTGPSHPHLHSNGSLTHPIIVLFNALITGKRIVFLGHNRPAGQVANYVLSACALGSGCGTILRGFIERAFPYANLTKRDEWESIPGYIAGVTNLIFESSRSWDLLCDVGTGRMVVSKDIHINFPLTPSYGPGGPLITRSGTLRAESSGGSEDDFGRPREKPEARADNYDNIFMEDIISAISYHFGESLVQARFTDYVARFVRLAARYDEEMNGSTKMGFTTLAFSERYGERPRLGSGAVFNDEAIATREMTANASRIEGWRKTKMCEYYEPDFQASLASDSIKGVDVLHQVHRLRIAKNLPDSEVELVMRTLAENVQSYEQVIELLSLVPPHLGGLLPISFGLFHQQELIREYTVDIFNELRLYPIGVQFLQALNHFQRYAYVRLAHTREARTAKEQNYLYPPPAMARTPSNRSESSLGGG